MRLLIIIALVASLIAGWLLRPQSRAVVNLPADSVQRPLPPEIATLRTSLIKDLDSLFVSSGIPGAAVVVVYDSQIIFLQGFGVRDVHQQKPVNGETVFRLASVSKPLTATLIAKLVQEQKLQWTTKVDTVVSGFQLSTAEATHALEVQHLLAHTTGLPMHAYTNLIEANLSQRELLIRLRQVQLNAKVGTLHNYQNVAFSLLSEVVRNSTRRSFEKELQASLFQPLQMQQASTSRLELLSAANHAFPHSWTGNGWNTLPIKETYYNTVPAGGINASAEDLGKWLIALLGNRPELLSNEILDEMFAPRIAAPLRNGHLKNLPGDFDSAYGMGWRILTSRSDTLAYHGGFVNNFRSEIGLDRKRKLGIAILANAPGSLTDEALALFFRRILQAELPENHPQVP